MSAREEQASGEAAGQRPDQSGRVTTSSTRYPPHIQQRPSTYSTARKQRPGQDRQTSYGSFQTQHDDDVGPNQPVTAQESRRAHAYANSLSKQRTEKKSDSNRFYVDNSYFDLNPWYDEEPKRPVFGMNRPFPRTVRPGMLWGRNKTQQAAAGRNRDGGGGNGRPTLHVPLDESEEPPPNEFDVEIGGNYYEVERMKSRGHDDGDGGDAPGISREDHAPEADDGSTAQSQSQARPRYTSGYSGGLAPLEETHSVQSFETSQTEAEKKKSREHEEAALQDYYNKYRNPLARLRAKYPEAPAEFLCTLIYVFFGIAGTLYSLTYPAMEGDYQTQGWAWGMAVMAGIFVGGGVSGAHMSPWISVCFSVYRGFPWKMCAVYTVAQILGGLVAGILAWAVYRDGIMNVDPQLTATKTGMAFYSTPADYVSLATAFFNNFLSAALYVCVLFAVGDDSNTPPGSGMSALIYGLLTYMLTITMGYNGLGISPARDLGPRLIAWWVGYGSTTFSTGWWAYGPIFAGLSGSLVGALVYDVLVFSGGESPVNYSWPTMDDLRNRVDTRKEEAKRKAQEIPV